MKTRHIVSIDDIHLINQLLFSVKPCDVEEQDIQFPIYMARIVDRRQSHLLRALTVVN